MGTKEASPPYVTAVFSLAVMAVIFIFGKLRDLIGGTRRPRKGYAPIRELHEDFYQRRMYGRIYDCWNRPIGSAPGAWFDILERNNMEYKSGFQYKKLEMTGVRKTCLNLGSYNYLGFAAHDDYCTPRVQATLKEWGPSMCSPRATTGTTTVHQELEETVAKFLGKEAAITFGMGFATNSVTIPALVGKGCLILSDALNHSSIVTGARSSGAKTKVFRHNDPAHLEELLRESIAEGQPRTHRPWKKIMVVVEGIYSMEGEVPPLKEIVEVKKKYKAYLYLDEAHSIGALGATGRGATEQLGVDRKDVDIMMGTFTKSFGSCGGYIAGSRQLIDFLRVNSPAHVYSTSMSPVAAQQIISAFRLIMGEDGSNRGIEKIRQLHDNANYMRQRLMDMGLEVLGDFNSPVMPIMIYHPAKIAPFSRICLRRNVAVVVVGFPATTLLTSRCRVCISASHTREDINYALEVIGEAAHVCMMRYHNKPLEDHLADIKDGTRAALLKVKMP